MISMKRTGAIRVLFTLSKFADEFTAESDRLVPGDFAEIVYGRGVSASFDVAKSLVPLLTGSFGARPTTA